MIDPQQTYEAGMAAYKTGDFARALEDFSEATKSYPPALLAVAQWYDVHHRRARERYEQRDRYAQVGEHFNEFKELADQGDSLGCYCVGVCYEQGLNCAPNAELAVSYYRVGAEAGHALCQFQLAWCYEKRGWGGC